MIFAAVLVLVAGFAMGIGYIWGSRNATNNILNELAEQEKKAYPAMWVEGNNL